MRRLEILDSQRADYAKTRGEKYTSFFDGMDECRWSFWKNMSADKMLKHVSTNVFPFIKNLDEGDDSLYSKYMEGATFMIQKPSLLQETVSALDELNITSRNQDVQGDIYEYLLSELKISGTNDQFRTPRHIIRMIIELVDPQLGETICDPSSGTGGFLINAYQYIVKKHTSDEMIEYDQDGSPHNLIGDKITKKHHWDLLKNKSIYGFDFDYTMLRIGVMNMVLHGIRHPNIKYGDALSKNFDQSKKYDMILANPPFAGSIDKGDINDNFSLPTTKTSLLFLELFYNLLKIGGRAGIIIPDSELATDTNAHKKIRRILLEKCQIEAIITMPSGVFKPYAGVTSAVVIFVKGGKTENVWFYEMQEDGYTLDDKRNPLDQKGDIPDIIKKFRTKKVSKNSLLINSKKIIENNYILDPTDYKKFQSEEQIISDPKNIINEISKLEKSIQDNIKELSKLIKDD